jgi:anthranilate phosphoribosyltransferase
VAELYNVQEQFKNQGDKGMTKESRFVHGGGAETGVVIDEWKNEGGGGPLAPHIFKMIEGRDLDADETTAAMNVLMNGEAADTGIASFLAALGEKGITPCELVSMARSMRQYASSIDPDTSGFKGLLADTCGTGGDRSGTLNVSTAAAFVVAAADIPVAKHGNRSVTSSCGSADVLEVLGAVIDLPPDAVKKCIETVGIGFLFARRFHSSMRHVAGARAKLAAHGLRSAFNLLGPLTNPAGAKAQLLGVFDPCLTVMFASALGELGCKRALCVHGFDAEGAAQYDEISIAGPTLVAELDGSGAIRTYEITPSTMGLDVPADTSINGGENADEAAAILREVLAGERRDACRSIVVANAGAAIYAGLPEMPSLRDSAARAAELIDNGAALEKLDAFVAATQSMES